MDTTITPSRFQLPAPAVATLREALAPAFRVAPPAPPTPRPEYTTSRVKFGDPADGHFTEAVGGGSFASLAELLRASGVDFTVETVPVHDPEGRKAKGHYLSRRPDTGEVFGIVSGRYAPISPVDAFAALLGPAVAAGVAKPTRAGHIVGTSFVQARIALRSAEILPGDTVDPLLTAAHNYGGKRASFCGLCLVRPVCANTMMMAYREMGEAGLRIVKSGNAQAVHGRMVAAGDALNAAANVYATAVASWRLMAQRPMTRDDLRDLIRRVFELSNDREGRARLDKLNAAIQRAAEGGRGANIKGVRGTVWGGMNAISEYWQHEQAVRATDGASEADRRTARGLLESGSAAILSRLQIESLRSAGVSEEKAAASLVGDRQAWGLAADWQP